MVRPAGAVGDGDGDGEGDGDGDGDGDPDADGDPDGEPDGEPEHDAPLIRQPLGLPRPLVLKPNVCEPPAATVAL